MHDFRALVRQRFSGSRALSDQAVDELAQHIEETWRAARAGGKSDEDALALAREQLDRPARLPSNMVAPSSAGISGLVSTAWRDIRYAVRMLAARPGFTAVAVLTLGLGIGANTAVFSVVRSLLLEPLPFRDPDRLVMLWEVTANDPDDIYIVSAPNYQDWRRSIKSFEETAIWEAQNFNFSGDVEAERVPGLRVSASAFRMLGVPALMGRTFKDEEDQPGHDVAVISFGLWQRRYGGRPDIVGSGTRINGRPFEIIGVMPSTFRFVNRNTAVWTPIAFNENDHDRGSHSFQAAARLRPGVSLPAAKAELDALGRSLAKPVSRREPERISDAHAHERPRRRATAPHAHSADGCRRPRSGDRLPQRGQPAARTIRFTPSRVRRPFGAWRVEMAHCRPGPVRSARHRDDWRCGGHRCRGGGNVADGRRAAARHHLRSV